MSHTRPNRPDWPTLVEQHSPGVFADQKMALPVGGGPILVVTEAPRLDYFSRSTPRPALAAATERVRLLGEVDLPDSS